MTLTVLTALFNLTQTSLTTGAPSYDAVDSENDTDSRDTEFHNFAPWLRVSNHSTNIGIYSENASQLFATA